MMRARSYAGLRIIFLVASAILIAVLYFTMMTDTDNAVFDRYLRLLGVSRRRPSIDALNELVYAHMTRVPFENISKLYHVHQHNQRALPTLEQYLYRIEHYHCGGTCYTNNGFLHRLLADLGYEARLCGADMNEPDCHLVNMVMVEGREFLIDTGYAAPFTSPIPRDLTTDYEVRLGRERYVLRPADGRGNSRMDLYRDGELVHGYTAKPMARRIDDFKATIADSYTSASTFMRSLLLVRLYDNRSVVVRDLSLIQSEGEQYKVYKIPHKEELPAIVEEHFDIPRDMVVGAIAELRRIGGIWS